MNYRILLVNLEEKSFGGQETHTMALANMLRSHGHYVVLLVAKNSPLSKAALEQKHDVYQTMLKKYASIRPLFNILFSRLIHKLCGQKQFTIIHCNNRFEVPGALKSTAKLATKVLLTRHLPDDFKTIAIKGIDAAIGVNKDIANLLEQKNREQNLNIKHISYIPPLFNAQKFLDHTPTAAHKKSPRPVICMIGNMVQDLRHKNYPLLLAALHILIHEKHKQLQALLVGDGPSRSHLEQLTEKLGLTNHVLFLGRSNDTAAIIQQSDIFVLASSKEAFGIVYLEAGLMKKPAIGATKTGAEEIILPEKTGLLFKNDDALDLAHHIERLIDKPEWTKELGQNAYEHVMKNFSPEITFAKYEKIYQELQAPDQLQYRTPTAYAVTLSPQHCALYQSVPILDFFAASGQ